ncbi:adenylate/guanylate cyclase domain-containing protein [Actinotalea sp.]|uniref:adenylate/guanylate cyclase domain-containing protein n=1 Tax=Actinotalea sp. TaxID=1872145 RepID=UPI0035639290
MATPPQDPAGEDSTLAEIERVLLGGPASIDLAEAARMAGVPSAEIRRIWNALGLVVPEVGGFTRADVWLVRQLHAAESEFEVSDRTGVSLVRAVGHTTDRLVSWQVEGLVEHMRERYRLDDASARLMVLDRLPSIISLLEAQLLHGWRRQLAALAARIDAELGQAHRMEESDELPLLRAVGLADIVGFTGRTADLGSHALADFVHDFEAVARDVVTAGGGRVIKTVGDAVLFVADDAGAGARVATELARTFSVGSESPVRVGLVWGRVLSRFGDVFGPAVSLAARLSDVAEPGTVLLDGGTATALGAVPGAVLETLGERMIPGVGTVPVVRLLDVV